VPVWIEINYVVESLTKMSRSEDNSNPENIEWKHKEHFHPVQYLKEIRRGDETTREIKGSNEIRDLTTLPPVRLFDEICQKWEYEKGATGGYPHADKVGFRIALNRITPRPYDKIIRNGDSYFSAGKLTYTTSS
jgi:hypothetical protein